VAEPVQASLNVSASTTCETTILATPVGLTRIITTEIGLARLHFPEGEHQPATSPSTSDIVHQLESYLAGNLRRFTISLDLGATSHFTRGVLVATAGIPYGETRTYGEIAQVIGSPGATQAVGNALGANPIPIVIPCHRVIRGDGRMGGYTGGAGIKRMLLGLEGVQFPVQQSLEISSAFATASPQSESP
jgi:methylated-DNA-[protein]-cysteine S-methyltransferase